MFHEGVPHDQTILMMSVGLRDMVCKEKGVVIRQRIKQLQ